MNPEYQLLKINGKPINCKYRIIKLSQKKQLGNNNIQSTDDLKLKTDINTKIINIDSEDDKNENIPTFKSETTVISENNSIDDLHKNVTENVEMTFSKNINNSKLTDTTTLKQYDDDILENIDEEISIIPILLNDLRNGKKIDGYEYWCLQISILLKNNSCIQANKIEIDEGFKFKKQVRDILNQDNKISKKNIRNIKHFKNINNNHLYICDLQNTKNMNLYPTNQNITSDYRGFYWKVNYLMVPYSKDIDTLDEFVIDKMISKYIDFNININNNNIRFSDVVKKILIS